eukprot:2257191-Heterocapsa_arctica.AAC.1
MRLCSQDYPDEATAPLVAQGQDSADNATIEDSDYYGVPEWAIDGKVKNAYSFHSAAAVPCIV